MKKAFIVEFETVGDLLEELESIDDTDAKVIDWGYRDFDAPGYKLTFESQ